MGQHLEDAHGKFYKCTFYAADFLRNAFFDLLFSFAEPIITYDVNCHLQWLALF
jgi:hypothetical protein